MKQFTKTLLITGVIITLSLAFFYYLGQKNDALVLQVQVVVKGDLSNAAIEDVTAHLELVSKLALPKGTLLITPGVTVVVIQNMQMIGEWTSVPYNGTGVYNITVGLTKYPEPGETVRVIARVVDSQSQNIAVAPKDITLT